MKKIFSFLLTLLALFSVMAQTTVEMTVDKNPVGVNQRFTLSFKVVNPSNGGDVNFNPPNTFQVLGGPNQSRSYNYVNGKSESSLTWSYVLRATKAGKVTIPGASYEYNGKIYKARPIQLEVSKSGAVKTKRYSNLYIKATASKTKPFVGEKVVISYKLYSRYNNIDLSNVNYPTYDGVWSEELEPKGEQISAKTETINGVAFRVFTLKKDVIYPQVSGKIDIPAMTADLIVGRSFFEMGQQVALASEPITLKVKPLPNQPSDFSGLIGDFTIKSSYSKTEVDADEAINLNVSIAGNGNLKLINEIPFEFSDDFEVYDPEIDDNIKISSAGINGKRTFKYLIIPRYSGEYTVPEVKISYFDLGDKKFKNLVVPSQKIVVKKGKPSPNASVDGITVHNQKSVEAKASDINYINTGDGKDIYTSVWQQSWIYWLTYGLGFVVFLALFFYQKKQNSISPAEHRKRGALSIAKQSLNKDAELDSVGLNNVIETFIYNRYGIETVNQEKSKITEAVKDSTLVDQLFALKEEINFSQYAGGYFNKQKLVGEIEQCLTQLNSVA